MFKREHGTMDSNWQPIVSPFLIGATLISGAILGSVTVSADDSVVDKINIKVPVACTLSGVGMNTHTASIAPGNYNSAIGETTVKAICNDFEGFGIYAIGYTDEEDGKNVLTNSVLGSANDIITGTGLSGNSQWAMKLTAITNPTPTYPITIQNSFDSFHTVPDDYTLVAKRTTQTDSGENAEGASFKTTYQAYISSNQAAGTYTGKVKYVLVHPHTTPTPRDTMLDTGQVVSAKMKTLAAGTTKAYDDLTGDIKAIRMADSLPAGFVPSDTNTVSTSTSTHPVYIFFDNTNDAGIMYFYTGGYQVVMNPDSSHLFRNNYALADISGLEYWDSSNVTNMRGLFFNCTISLTNLNGLQRWDTSNVENMHTAFASNNAGITAAGKVPHLSDLSALSNWDTGSVTNMEAMFQGAFSLSSLRGLELWDTSNVENMYGLFVTDAATVATVGQPMQLSDISALANWNTGNVTDMSAMFQDNTSLTNIDALKNWDTKNVEQMRSMFNATSIINLDALADWDVSSVESMKGMFMVGGTEYNNGIRSQLSDISGLSGWVTGNVTDMSGMFQHADMITDITPLTNWDTSNVNVMSNMFKYTYNLTDASPIKDWDVRAVTNFNTMFGSSGATPEPFTLLPGTWNSSGTYVPSS